ncbi:hypothetical protein ACET79_02840 [Aeromonas veronii]
MWKSLRGVRRFRGNIALFGVVVLFALLTGRHTETIGPQEDVLISVQRGDTRLFAVMAGSDQIALGFPFDQQSIVKGRCGIRGLKVPKNAIRKNGLNESMELQLYAGEYNQLMLPHCVKANKRKPLR